MTVVCTWASLMPSQLTCIYYVNWFTITFAAFIVCKMIRYFVCSSAVRIHLLYIISHYLDNKCQTVVSQHYGYDLHTYRFTYVSCKRYKYMQHRKIKINVCSRMQGIPVMLKPNSITLAGSEPAPN